MPKVVLAVTVDRDLFNRIENHRGLIKRSNYVERLLWLALKLIEGGEKIV